MSDKERTAAQLIRKFDLHDRLRRFTDIRTNPSIPLPTILVCVLLMPVLYLPSMLAVDRVARRKWLKRLCGTPRAMVSSDSTLRRTLDWLSRDELQRCMHAVVNTLCEHRLLSVRLAGGERKRRMAVVDGTYMSGHWMAVACLTGITTAVASLRHCRGKGWERHEGRELIKQLAAEQTPAVELVLLDSLYFDRVTFAVARRYGVDVLVKSENADYRSVTADTENYLDNCGADKEDNGYDEARLCRWAVEVTPSSFAGYPVQVARVTERFSKNGETHQFWITTTDCSLTPAELREAAHRRWAIETYFKQLNASVHSKRFALRDPHAFTAMLTLVCIGTALADAARAMLAARPCLARRFLAGEKPTRRAWMMRMADCLPERVFAFSV